MFEKALPALVLALFLGVAGSSESQADVAARNNAAREKLVDSCMAAMRKDPAYGERAHYKKCHCAAVALFVVVAKGSRDEASPEGLMLRRMTDGNFLQEAESYVAKQARGLTPQMYRKCVAP